MFSFLRVMTESDLAWVLKTEQQAYRYPWSQQGFENALNQGLNYIISNEADLPLGYICLLPVLDEAHLLNICVAPDFQKKSIASHALLALKEKLKSAGFNVIYLEVRVSNLAAIALYAKYGFVEDAKRKDYYPSDQAESGREDAILMSCPL